MLTLLLSWSKYPPNCFMIQNNYKQWSERSVQDKRLVVWDIQGSEGLHGTGHWNHLGRGRDWVAPAWHCDLSKLWLTVLTRTHGVRLSSIWLWDITLNEKSGWKNKRDRETETEGNALWLCEIGNGWCLNRFWLVSCVMLPGCLCGRSADDSCNPHARACPWMLSVCVCGSARKHKLLLLVLCQWPL